MRRETRSTDAVLQGKNGQHPGMGRSTAADVDHQEAHPAAPDSAEDAGLRHDPCPARVCRSRPSGIPQVSHGYVYFLIFF